MRCRGWPRSLAAHIAVGDYLNLDKEEARDFLKLWLRSYTERNGEQSLDEFDKAKREATKPQQSLARGDRPEREHSPEATARRRQGLRNALKTYMEKGEAGVDQYLDQVENQAKTDRTSSDREAPADQAVKQLTVIGIAYPPGVVSR